jgi:hypothetical protein
MRNKDRKIEESWEISYVCKKTYFTLRDSLLWDLGRGAERRLWRISASW